MDSSLAMRFQGAEGMRRMLQALRQQSLIHDDDLASEFAGHVKVMEVPAGTTLITQSASDTDLYLILDGEFSIEIDGRVIAHRATGEHVGEMAMVDPQARRTASVKATTDSVVARIAEAEFSALADRYPRLWRRVALEFATRLRREETIRQIGANLGRAA